MLSASTLTRVSQWLDDRWTLCAEDTQLLVLSTKIRTERRKVDSCWANNFSLKNVHSRARRERSSMSRCSPAGRSSLPSAAKRWPGWCLERTQLYNCITSINLTRHGLFHCQTALSDELSLSLRRRAHLFLPHPPPVEPFFTKEASPVRSGAHRSESEANQD